MGSRYIKTLSAINESHDAGYKKLREELHDINPSNFDIQCANIENENQDVDPSTFFSDVMAKNCLSQQEILKNASKRLVEKIYRSGNRKTVAKDVQIANQGDPGGSVYFILQGSIDVKISERLIATRYAKECVGEMSAIDPTKRRSATLVAAENVEMLELSYDLFNKILDKKPKILLRNLLGILCNRLCERSKFFVTPNKTYNFFIGSSSDAKGVVNIFRNELNAEFKRKGIPVAINVWYDKTFPPSQSNLESLINEAQRSDFATFFLTPDDMLKIGDMTKKSPRDNVIFELGLFMGSIGRNRTYVLSPQEEHLSMRFPTDLDGITRLLYTRIEQEDVAKSVQPSYDFSNAISQICENVKDKGARL